MALVKKFQFTIFVISFGFAVAAHAGCAIKNSDNTTTAIQDDPLYKLLTGSLNCAADVIQLKANLAQAGYSTRPSMIDNRGFNNPSEGVFSFFEEVYTTTNPGALQQGHFFFGHFTALSAGYLILDKNPQKNNPGKLLIESIAWNEQKGLYDFYELIGMGPISQWFYRGDSGDILADNANMYIVDPGGTPQLGKTLRCSGCHASGGPIMKELAAPHNDWWRTDHQLPFGPYKKSAEIENLIHQLVDADDFSKSVQAGMASLENSVSYQGLRQAMSLQAQLRPLFCENEVNLESDGAVFDFTSAGTGSPQLKIPSGFFLNPLFGAEKFSIDAVGYKNQLTANQMTFAGGGHDADHAWLTPVKGYSDLLAIDTLITSQRIDRKFALAVLSVDLQHPLFSADRCGLLKLLPAESGANWQIQFQNNLRASSLPAAALLVANLASDEATFQAKVASYVQLLQTGLADPTNDSVFFADLLKARQNVFDSEISKNPRGQIFEPGFKILFPTANTH